MRQLQVVSLLDGRHLPQLQELLEAATRVDGHGPVGEHKFLRLQRGDDLAVAVLAFEGARLAGYAQSVVYGDGAGRRASSELVVHPDFRRHGVGRKLLTQALAHAYEQSARQLDVWAYNDRGAGAQIAEDFGFTPARRLLHLHRDVVDVPDLAAPPGVVLRPMWAGEEGALLALNNRIFAAHPENGSWTMEDLRARMVQPWFDRGDVLILERNGAPAGFCWLKIEARPGEGRVAEIYVIGTAPEARGLGLGRLLVARGLAHAVARDADVAAIYVEDSNAAAVALYTSSGFHHHHVDVCYSRRFEANEAAPTVEPAQEASAA